MIRSHFVIFVSFCLKMLFSVPLWLICIPVVNTEQTSDSPIATVSGTIRPNGKGNSLHSLPPSLARTGFNLGRRVGRVRRGRAVDRRSDNAQRGRQSF